MLESSLFANLGDYSTARCSFLLKYDVKKEMVIILVVLRLSEG